MVKWPTFSFSITGSSSRRTSPSHASGGGGGGGGSSPRPERKQTGKSADSEHQSTDDRGGSPSTKGHRTLTTVSSSDSRADSPLIGLGSATLVRKLMPGSFKKKADDEREGVCTTCAQNGLFKINPALPEVWNSTSYFEKNSWKSRMRKQQSVDFERLCEFFLEICAKIRIFVQTPGSPGL